MEEKENRNGSSYQNFCETAWGNAIKVNPSHPELVAQNIGEMIQVIKRALALLDKQREEYNSTMSLLPRKPVGEGEIAKAARQVLSAITKEG